MTANMGRISYTRPSITELEVTYATDAAANGWGERCYDYIVRFEDGFRRHLGVDHAIATSSCTGAMHMGLAALGVGQGDEIILADTNWIATAAPVVHIGATPVFVDILADSWCIDPAEAERHITPRTKAIVATHIYGNLCDMDRLLDIGRRHGIAIIEDAAEAIGSEWQGRRAGSMGTFGTFSFHGTKTLTTGEGGMFVTSDSALFEKVLTLSNHGRARGQKKQFWPDEIGFKYKMSNIQAALGCAQLERIDSLIARKRDILARYAERLKSYQCISLNPEYPRPEYTGPEYPRPEYPAMVNGAWMPTAVFDRDAGITRDMLQQAFAEANIDARVFFHPLSSLPMFAERRDNRIAWDIPERAINLPSYHDMTEAEIGRVTDVIIGLIDNRMPAALRMAKTA